MTRYEFYPNRFAFILFVVLCLLLGSVTVLAQDTPEPLATNTAVVEVTPTDEPLPDEIPDISPDINQETDNLNTFLVDAKVVIAAIVLIVTQALKFILPANPNETEEQRSARTQQIFLGVVALFSTLYFVGNLTGYLERIQAGINFLTVIADPVWQLITAFGGASALYMIGRLVNSPALAGRQSAKAFHLDPPKPVKLLTPQPRIITVPPTAVSASPTPVYLGRE